MSDPLWEVVPDVVEMVTVCVVPVVMTMRSVAASPKSPTQECSRSTCVGVCCESVIVSDMGWPSSTESWSAVIETTRSCVLSVDV